MIKHTYYLARRDGRGNFTVDEAALRTLLYNREVEHDYSVHVGTDARMSHYFKFRAVNG